MTLQGRVKGLPINDCPVVAAAAKPPSQCDLPILGLPINKHLDCSKIKQSPQN